MMKPQTTTATTTAKTAATKAAITAAATAGDPRWAAVQRAMPRLTTALSMPCAAPGSSAGHRAARASPSPRTSASTNPPPPRRPPVTAPANAASPMRLLRPARQRMHSCWPICASGWPTAEEEPSLADLAARAGMSPFHLQRVFKAALGVSPKAYAKAQRRTRLQHVLADEAGAAPRVIDAIFDAGFASTGQLYRDSHAVLGMTPSQYRTGGAALRIGFGVGECSLGPILVAATDQGICAILLGDDADALVQDLQQRFAHADLQGGDAAFERWMAQVIGFVDEPTRGLALPLDVRGTAFQQQVWQALRGITGGQHVSYSELAATLGMPQASRAVAAPAAANAIAVAITVAPACVVGEIYNSTIVVSFTHDGNPSHLRPRRPGAHPAPARVPRPGGGGPRRADAQRAGRAAGRGAQCLVLSPERAGACGAGEHRAAGPQPDLPRRIRAHERPHRLFDRALLRGQCVPKAICVIKPFGNDRMPPHNPAKDPYHEPHHHLPQPRCAPRRMCLARFAIAAQSPRHRIPLKTPPDRATLLALIAAMGVPVRAVLREAPAPYAEWAGRPEVERCATDRLHAGAAHPHQPPHRCHAAGHAAVPAFRGGAGHPAAAAATPFNKSGASPWWMRRAAVSEHRLDLPHIDTALLQPPDMQLLAPAASDKATHAPRFLLLYGIAARALVQPLGR
ncbi:hypothetical protein FQA39_LY18676 [Lamprigera yunnana]|nr:hypothetical protein FQA39_LY18676 [Lamprigera yunnana]